jgi:hypothetical protein
MAAVTSEVVDKEERVREVAQAKCWIRGCELLVDDAGRRRVHAWLSGFGVEGLGCEIEDSGFQGKIMGWRDLLLALSLGCGIPRLGEFGKRCKGEKRVGLGCLG